MHNVKQVMCYVFIFVIYSSLLFLISPAYAQNSTKGFLTFRNCAVEFLYLKDWKNYIRSNSSDACEESRTYITIPQPSLSEKIISNITIIVETCCPDFVDQSGQLHLRNMTLDQYLQKNLDTGSTMGWKTIDYGPITLDGNPAYRLLREAGLHNRIVEIYSIYGTKLYKIQYIADLSDYSTYLKDVQKIVDSFKMFVS